MIQWISLKELVLLEVSYFFLSHLQGSHKHGLQISIWWLNSSLCSVVTVLSSPAEGFGVMVVIADDSVVL